MRKFLAVTLMLLVAGCAVRQYPRPVSVRDQVASNNAWALDTMAAALIAKLNAGGDYDIARQHATIDYSYYLDPRFKSDPRSFYPRPAAPPEPRLEKLGEDGQVEYFLVSWPSQYTPQNPAFAATYAGYVEDHTAYGVYCRAKNKNRGAVVISHGWTGPSVKEQYKSAGQAGLATIGYDSVLVQHPYHGLREPRGSKFSGEYFLSGEVARTNEAMCQTVTDVRSMVMWLRPGYEVVGLRGGSLGGIATLQAAAVEAADFAVAWVPPSSFGEFPEDSPLIPYIIRGMKESGISTEKAAEIYYVSSPKNFSPLIPKEDILIIAGMADNFVPPAQSRMVWEAYGRPMIFWFAGGHVLNYDQRVCDELERQFMVARLK